MRKAVVGNNMKHLRDSFTSADFTSHSHTAVPVLARRFLGYLSADGLNYLLGFLIYGWLVRVLSNQQYGKLSIATTVYQTLMMVTALGLDLTGAALIKESGFDYISFARRAQHLRLVVALLVCAPLQAGAALVAWKHRDMLLATLILASFSMVLARALDLTYLAVALRVPAPLAKTRALGLAVYLALLMLCTPIVRQHLWLVPVLNAIGVTIGRVKLGRLLRHRVAPSGKVCSIRVSRFFIEGFRTGGGQLLLLILQTGDVILLTRYVSADVVGQYAIISRLYVLGIAVLGAMFNTFLPEVVHVADEIERLKSIFLKCVGANLALGVIGGAAFYWFSAPLSEFLGHRSLISIHAISPVFALVFLLMAITNPFLSMLPSFRRDFEYLICIASGLLVLLAADLTFIPRHGAIAAAWGQAVATLYLGFFSIIVFFRHIRYLRTAATNAAVVFDKDLTSV
jgi:O-antigen/teichoic acid export membrane protein